MDLKELDNQLRRKTVDAINYSRKKWKERHNDLLARKKGANLVFLGTGGNPEAVIGQKPRTGGFLIHLGDLYMMVDPGPGAILSMDELNIDLGMLDAVYISHGHVDHYAGVERVIEGMCWAMSVKRGAVLGPRRIFEEDKQISDYHQGDSHKSGYSGGPEVIFLEKGKEIKLREVTLTPTVAYHGFENYGFILEHQGFKLGYTSDTNYISKLRGKDGIIDVTKVGIISEGDTEILEYRQDVKDTFQDVDVLIANITTHNAWFHRHITTMGLAHLLKGSKVKECYLTHFNFCCVEPEDLREPMASYVEAASGVKTFAAYDKKVIDFSKYFKK